MADKKPKAKVAPRKTYPQSELKKIGMGYDKIGFKDSAIDMLKNKMSQHVTEWNDIVPESTMPAKPQMSSREFVLRGRKGYDNDTMIDYSKRTGYTQRAYGPAVGELTGKKGVSKTEYGKYKNLMQAYRDDPSLDANISDTVYQEQLYEKERQKRINEATKARKK
jgi:hypothetical protein